MNIIKDIRLYKSDCNNIDGNSLPSGFSNKKLDIITFRIVIKLRENGFSFEDFDHLYVNFTTCIEENKIIPASRSVDKYHPWYRYYDVGVSNTLYEQLSTDEVVDTVLYLLKHVLTQHFATNSTTKEMVDFCFAEAIGQGENMRMKFKEKVSAKNSAIIYLRWLDKCSYLPLLIVYDSNNNIILERELPETNDLLYIGDIQLSSKRVTIKPRNNSLAKGLKPIAYDFRLI